MVLWQPPAIVGYEGFSLNSVKRKPVEGRGKKSPKGHDIGIGKDRGFGNIGTESPVKPSSATIAALYELFLVNNRIAQWSQFGVLAANVRKIYSSVLYAMLTGQLARPITALSAAHLTIAE